MLIFVLDVDVRDNFRVMYRKTSWNILFFNVSRVLVFIECLEMIVVDLA